jgi:hypothetical protein
LHTLDQLTSSRPAAAPLSDKEQEKRAITIGLLATVLFHALLFGLAPFFPAEKFAGSHSNLDAIAAAQRKEFNFELTPMTEAEKQANNPFRFVETNPDAPENTPDKTNNYSDRNQQSAQQEKPKEVDPENRPSTQGRDDIRDSSAIVSGNRAPPQPGEAAVPLQQALEQAVPQQAQQAQAQRAEQVPLSGFEKVVGDNPEGVGTNVSQQKTPSTGADQFLEGSRDVRNLEGAATPQQEQQAKQLPKQRPRLASASTARQSPLSNRLAGTMNIGPVGIDARWSEFGQYMRELIDTVDAEFQAITNEYRGHINAGTRVVVTFALNSDGEVKVTQVEETAGRVAVSQCQSAITNRMPYKKWSKEMIAVLGDQQTITFAFYYY